MVLPTGGIATQDADLTVVSGDLAFPASVG